jgi:exosortase A-associated hydrolase 1
MNSREIPLAFECQGQPLIGIVHLPEQPRSRGVLAIVAGGPQYRAGHGRQLIQMARTLSAQGTPVMRFDYRGLGDSAGEFEGFQHMGPDLKAAIDAFTRHVPSLKEIVLWGGCDAASAALIHGPEHSIITGMILGNPFVHSEETHAKVVVRHYYLKRIREKAFWMKILKFRFNPFRAFGEAASALRLARKPNSNNQQQQSGQKAPFPIRMLEGAQKFQGRILLLMSGLSLVSKEFDALVSSSPEWSAAIHRDGVTRVDFPDADQAFSTASAREEQIGAASSWLDGLD